MPPHARRLRMMLAGDAGIRDGEAADGGEMRPAMFAHESREVPGAAP